MSITFRIGKDDITRKIKTCLLPLELVKTTKINRLGIGRTRVKDSDSSGDKTGSLGNKGSSTIALIAV